MNLYSIKQGVINLSSIDFFRFFSWFEKYGWKRINNFTKSSKLRQVVLNLSEKELDAFDDWLDILWAERWNEEVENDPLARQCRELGNIIMSKLDPDRFTADLPDFGNDSKDKE